MTSSIIHEDTLLNLGVLQPKLHTKLAALKTKTKKNSGFISWLGIESVQILKEVFLAIKNTLPSLKKSTSVHTTAALAPEDEEGFEEEEWDKEDVEEIEGNKNQLCDVRNQLITFLIFLNRTKKRLR